MGKITIFSGGYGSGKSEIALNFALEQQTHRKDMILADLDYINPYFVSRELKNQLEHEGIRVLSPAAELLFGDVPQIPPDIISCVKQDHNMIIDVAGDESGAAVLGYLSGYIERGSYEFYLVLNPFRPFSRETNDVLDLRANLEKASRLKFTGVVSNPNLVEDTSYETILEGHQRVVEFAAALGLPLYCLTVEERYYERFFPAFSGMVKKMKLHLRPPWF